MNTFGERLRAERESKGFSQKDFADSLGITPTRLNYWEKNKREPDFYNIKKMIDILNCDADWLIGTKFSNKQDESTFTTQEQDHIEKYRALDDRGKKAVDDTLEREYGFVSPAEKEHSATCLPSDLSREEIHRLLDKQLDDEEKGTISSASTITNGSKLA